MPRLRHPWPALLLGFALVLGGCGRSTEPAAGRHPVIVCAIDGAEWRVIRELWRRYQLPVLERLAHEGASGPLATAYGASPVIWTTIATGRTPREHGITGFVVPGPEGDVPVSSTVRRVPALWNIASRAELETAVLGWWASWPAEAIRGVVVSDRALLDPDAGVSPPAFRTRFRELADQALARPTEFGGNPAARDRDRVVAHVARELADEGFDLMLVYFRGIDIASHLTWKAWQPERFPDADPEWLREHADDIPAVYRATDAALGEILAAAPAANVFVVSDHGFHAVREEVRVVLDLDRVLEALGLLARDPGGAVDPAHSLAYTYGSAPAENPKHLALGAAAPDDAPGRLQEAFSRVRYASGAPVLRVRPARGGEARPGASLVVEVLPEDATEELLVDGRALPGAVREIARISGSHGARTKGIFVAHGPDLDPGAGLEGIRIHDLAPTILYALGLPVGEDMAGVARTELFTEDFRRGHPLRTVATWGEPGDGRVTVSPEDQELIDELRGLGYL